MTFAKGNSTLEEVSVLLAEYFVKRRHTPTHLLIDVQTHKELLAELPEGVDVMGAFGLEQVVVFRMLAKKDIMFMSSGRQFNFPVTEGAVLQERNG